MRAPRGRHCGPRARANRSSSSLPFRSLQPTVWPRCAGKPMRSCASRLTPIWEQSGTTTPDFRPVPDEAVIALLARCPVRKERPQSVA